MKRFVFAAVFAVWGIVFGHNVSVVAEETIIWYKFDMPPVYIPSGKYANQGMLDLGGNLFREEMKGYSHLVTTANSKRVIADIEEKKKVVGEALLKTPEREKVVEFSAAHTLTFPYEIMTRKDRMDEFRPYMAADGSVMLEKLIAESRLRLVISLGRSYSSLIDEILNKYRTHENIMTRTSNTGILEGILNMISQQKADYTIAFPLEAYHIAKTKGKGDIFVSLPIAGMPKYILAYSGVPKNEWGRKILNQLDPIILKHRNTPKFREFAEAWMDENMKKRYRQYVEEAFGSERKE